MKRLVTILALSVAVLLGGLASAADSSSTLSRIVEKKEVRVGMSGSQPPFVMKDKSGEMMGFEVDLAKALAAAMDVKLKIVAKPFAELLPALERGEVDMVMSGLTITPERSLKFAFAGPYYVSGKSVLTKTPALAEITQAPAFNRENLTLVALEGSTSAAFAKSSLPKAKLKTAPDYRSAAQMVLDNKAQAMIADLPVCVFVMAQHPDAGLTTSGALLTMEPIGVALPLDDPQLTSLVKGLIDAMETTGEIEKATKYWFRGIDWLKRMP
jgi:ABC-type amino acid transport substrate-binding protein